MMQTAAQRLWLSQHAEAMQGMAARLQSSRALERLWAQDAGLWTQEPAAREAIRQRLGWLTIGEAMRPHLAKLARLRAQLRATGISRMLLLGMGGSALFAEVARELFGVAADGIDVRVLDTTDPTAILAAQQSAPAAALGLLVASKSGTTIEVQALAAYFLEALRAAGRPAGASMVVITDAGTPLEAQAKAWGAQQCFIHQAGAGLEVGGRFSALTYFGLVPAALIGADLDRLLGRAQAMLDACAPTAPVDENPALQLAALLAALHQAGQNTLTLLCPPALAPVGAWLEQMVAESLGKRGKGVIPVCGEPAREPSAYRRDRIFVELQAAERWDEELDRRARALSAAEHPVLRIHWQDRYDVGGEVLKWSIATALAGFLLDVDPFDEPNVQESKDQTKSLLASAASGARLEEPGPPACAEGEVTLYGPPPGATPADALREWIRALRPEDYLAVLSFLPRTEPIDAAARALRESFAARLPNATLLQRGPRYLHSTGQLFKGGPDTGAFIILTAADAVDAPVPGQRYTFAGLKQAQALGDVLAMRRRGRRVLHAHLRSPEAGLSQLIRLIGQA